MDWTIFTPICVAVISTIFGPFVGYFIRRHEVQDAKEANVQLKDEIINLKKAALPVQLLSCDDYGIRVVSPMIDEETGNKFPISGTYQRLPDNYSIWVSTFAGEGNNRQYWPQQKAIVDRNTHQWRSKVNWVGGSKGEYRKILVFVVGDDGQALFEYFGKAGIENKEAMKKKTGSSYELWPSITKLTKDTSECAWVKIKI